MFNKFLIGFYINSWSNKDGTKMGVRLSYFTTAMRMCPFIWLVRYFLRRRGLIEINPAVLPSKGSVALDYGGEQYELRFRKYLCLETQIGLELLRADQQHARSLAAIYRWQVFATRSPIKLHFEPSFVKYSETYNSLTDSQREQLWADLSFWPNRPQVDWAHFLINLIFSGDWNDLFKVGPFTPLSISDINNNYLKNLGFTIDVGWSPAV